MIPILIKAYIIYIIEKPDEILQKSPQVNNKFTDKNVSGYWRGMTGQKIYVHDKKECGICDRKTQQTNIKSTV